MTIKKINKTKDFEKTHKAIILNPDMPPYKREPKGGLKPSPLLEGGKMRKEKEQLYVCNHAEFCEERCNLGAKKPHNHHNNKSWEYTIWCIEAQKTVKCVPVDKTE